MQASSWIRATMLGLGALFVGAGGLGGLKPEAAAQPAAPHPGRAVYERACAACHDNPEATRSQPLSALKSMSAAALRLALTQGKMAAQGSSLTPGDLDQVVAYLASAAPQTDAWVSSNLCPADKRGVDLAAPETFTRFGVDYGNSRRLTAKAAGLTKANLANLEVAWAIGLPQTNAMRSAPVIVGSTLFYSASQAGYVFAIDTKSGCFKWAYKAPRPMRTSLSYGPLKGVKALVFGDQGGQVQAIDAATGRLIWSAEGRHDPRTMLTGAPILWRDRVIVPVSAIEVGLAMNPAYACCQSHGAVVALNAADGAKLWTAETMEAAKPTGEKNAAGAALWGPSGAPVWSTPAIDEAAGVVYVGTGQNTSLPATRTSDSVWAIDLATGKTKWFFNALEKDVWNMSCMTRGPNCPPASASALKDFDIGASIVIGRDAKGRRLLLAGQKSADVWGVDAAGQKVWNRKLGAGSPLGGVHWGMASDGKRLFVPIADPAGAGLHALDVATGALLWSYRSGAECTPQPACIRGAGMSAAPLAIGDAVIAAPLDGRLMVFDAVDGKPLAAYPTAQSFETLNGVAAKGGAIDAQSIAAGDGMVFVGSGYALFGAAPGNVLIAYRPKP